MNLSAALANQKTRFNALSLRERVMIAAALTALVVLLWNQSLMAALTVRQQALTQELQATQESLAALTASIEGTAQDNPMVAAVKRKQELTQSLAGVDAQLKSASAGLIPPEQMLQALRDVLASQRGVRLVSMRNFPVTALTPVVQTANGSEVAPATQGPYVHSLEMVLEGSYLDVLGYLQRVEALPWRFYWQIFELKTTRYPLNRVRIRLNTLSMDKEWLGV